MGDMYSIHCWNKFLYIIVAYFYILLEQLLCTSTQFYTLLERTSMHCYNTLTYICWNNYLYISTQFYTLLYTILYIILCIVFVGAVTIRVQ
jgi:hypothetical protein